MLLMDDLQLIGDEYFLNSIYTQIHSIGLDTNPIHI